MPKKLYRVENDKIIAGVCGGIGEYINRITSYNVCYTKLLRPTIG